MATGLAAAHDGPLDSPVDDLSDDDGGTALGGVSSDRVLKPSPRSKGTSQHPPDVSENGGITVWFRELTASAASWNSPASEGRQLKPARRPRP